MLLLIFTFLFKFYFKIYFLFLCLFKKKILHFLFSSLDADLQIWSVRKICPSKHSWVLVRLKAASPFSLLLFGTELFAFLQRKNATETSSSSPAFAFLPDFPSASPASPHQGENSSHHGAVTTTERWTVSANANMWVCRVIRDANTNRPAEREETQVFNFSC